jgi:NDP-sugar pyrophosphorylase family protein
MQCVILAGGLGSRMRPFTDVSPKTLIPVVDTPFAHYQLTWLARHGVTEVVYSIGFLGEQIRAYVGDGRRWGLKVCYVEDGIEPAGTAGALRRAYDAGVLGDWFLVLYGDSFLPIDFRDLGAAFERQSRPAMMTVY